MSSRKGAPVFSSLLSDCVCWFTGLESNEFPIIPSGVTVTNNGTFTKTDLGNNKSVLNFDGSTNYISLTDNDAWDLWTGTNATLTGWIQYADIATFKALLQQREDGDTYWYVSGIPSTSKLALVGRATDAGYAFYYDCPFTQIAETWYHIAIVKSGTSCLMYINSTSQSVTETQAWSALSCSATLDIGQYSSGFYAGNQKDLMIFTRALSQAEIKLLMNRTHPITGAGLMPANGDYYKLS